MSHKLHPIIDQWYWHRDKGQRFYVVAIDDRRKAIEVQHFDGEVEEFSFDEWHTMDIEAGAQPENWAGALDIDAEDDLGTEVTDTGSADWQAPQVEVPAADRATSEDGPATDAGQALGETIPGQDYGEGFAEAYQADLLDDTHSEHRTGPAMPVAAGLTRRADGILEETFNPPWYAEYLEDADTGLWQVRVFKRDVRAWTDTGLESLDEARQAALDFYDQV